MIFALEWATPQVSNDPSDKRCANIGCLLFVLVSICAVVGLFTILIATIGAL